MKKGSWLFIALIVLGVSGSCGQALGTGDSDTVTLHTATGDIEGTLLLPASIPENENLPAVLIIAGSGPTDRNGNNPMMTNNSLRLLAEGLAEKGIASVRYDKRAIGRSAAAGGDEHALRFDHYINDAEGWLEWIRSDGRFGEITVIGHSMGSLVGMVAAREAGADKFVSIAGAGEPGADAIRRQLESQPDIVKKYAYPILDSLAGGFLVSKVDPALNSLFRHSLQPYLLSWFALDPAEEISKLAIPVLILQGTTDLQTSVLDAEILADNAADGDLFLIVGMNHVLKTAPPERTKNIRTYNDPGLPLHPDLLELIAAFILGGQHPPAAEPR